mgnify:CR=1 FL=1
MTTSNEDSETEDVISSLLDSDSEELVKEVVSSLNDSNAEVSLDISKELSLKLLSEEEVGYSELVR